MLTITFFPILSEFELLLKLFYFREIELLKKF